MESGFCALQPAVAEIIVVRGLQRQTRVSSGRGIGIRHERGRATSSSLEKKRAGESSQQLHHRSLYRPQAAATRQMVREVKNKKTIKQMDSSFRAFSSPPHSMCLLISNNPLASLRSYSPCLSASVAITPPRPSFHVWWQIGLHRAEHAHSDW